MTELDIKNKINECLIKIQKERHEEFMKKELERIKIDKQNKINLIYNSIDISNNITNKELIIKIKDYEDNITNKKVNSRKQLCIFIIFMIILYSIIIICSNIKN